MVKFQPIARLNAILVVSRKPDLVASAGTWIARLDQSDNAGTNLKVYRLRYGNARQIAALLTDIFGARSTGAGASLDNAGSQLAPGGGATVSSNTGVLRSLGVPPPRQAVAIATTETPGGGATHRGRRHRPPD